MSSQRVIQVAELVRDQLGAIIIRELEVPSGTLITITRVTVSPDLRHATVYVSIMPDEQSRAMLGLLIRSAGHLRHELGEAIVAKAVPKLVFRLDSTAVQARHIDDLLDNLEY